MGGAGSGRGRVFSQPSPRTASPPTARQREGAGATPFLALLDNIHPVLGEGCRSAGSISLPSLHPEVMSPLPGWRWEKDNPDFAPGVLEIRQNAGRGDGTLSRVYAPSATANPDAKGFFPRETRGDSRVESSECACVCVCVCGGVIASGREAMQEKVNIALLHTQETVWLPMKKKIV